MEGRMMDDGGADYGVGIVVEQAPRRDEQLTRPSRHDQV